MDEQDRYCWYCDQPTDRADGYCSEEHRRLFQEQMAEMYNDEEDAEAAYEEYVASHD